MASVASVIFGLAALLALASLLWPLANRLNLPYTVLLAVVGTGLGLAVSSNLSATGLAGELIGGFRSLGVSSDFFLNLFLPALLFQAGLTIDSRRLMDDIGPVLVLAILAVLICTLVVGAGLSLVSGQALTVCLLLGAIISTTDSAAVVAIFRSIGAPRRLTVIVEGESLFNDAAAIAIFTLLLGLVTGLGTADLGSAALNLVWALTGGAAVGWLSGRATAALIGAVHTAPAAEVTLTVAMAYLTYLIAQNQLQVSGVVAVVVAAMVMGAEGRTRLSPAGWTSLVETWRQLDFWATSLIFTLAAMVAPSVLSKMGGYHIALSVAALVLALAARALVLYWVMPALSLLGIAEPISRRYKIVLWWGGMRGAVTVALALAISENPYVPPEIKPFIFTVATFFTLQTLFIMAPTLNPLIRALKLNRLTRRDMMVRDRVIALARQRVHERVTRVAGELRLAHLVPSAPAEPARATSDEETLRKELRQVALLTLADRESELYLDYFERGFVNGRISDILRTHASRLKDVARERPRRGYRAAAERFCAFPMSFRIALWLHRRTGWSSPLKDEIRERFELILVLSRVLRDLQAYNAASVSELVGETVAGEFAKELSHRQEQASLALEALDLQYPAYAESLRVRYVERIGLVLEEGEYRTQLAQSIISGEIFEELEETLSRRLRALDRRPPLDLGLRLSEMISRVPLFERADEETLARIVRLCRPELALPGERIIRRGERGDSMYFITAGVVEVAVPQSAVRLEAGQFFGELALLNDTPRTADVTAVGYANLLVLSRTDFRRLLRSNPALRAQIEAVAADRVASNTLAATSGGG
ncbi:MAG: cation:proton antiporter [Alphaproteobacteria bacterium]|nr:cation:proton antiporter [Alphaproteobacteria bacterium]